jgi:hypothetical protein
MLVHHRVLSSDQAHILNSAQDLLHDTVKQTIHTPSGNSAEQSPIPSSDCSNASAASRVARYEELQALVRRCERDFVKAYIKGNKEAGIRLRKQMQALRAFAKSVRDEVRALHYSSSTKRTRDSSNDMTNNMTESPAE